MLCRSSQQYVAAPKAFNPYLLSKYFLIILLIAAHDTNLFVQGYTDSLGLEPLGDFDPISSPRVALLMTFPKSGETFIQDVMHGTTNLTTANNYGMTMVNGQQVNTRQVWLDRTQGPFRQNELNIPQSGYILTKTHCGGWCYTCAPRNYWQSKTEFHKDCLVSYRHNKFVIQKVQYDGKLVRKAIHLIRDPFSNIVARFLRYEESKELPTFDPKKPVTITGYPMTITGFQTFCKAMNDQYYKEESDWFLKAPELAALMNNIPCRSEFWKYFQWHNMARANAEEIQQVPYYNVHYSDFKDNFEAERDKMLNFLELPKVNNSTDYNFTYMMYYYFFTIEQVKTIENLCKQMCHPWLYNELKRYFVDAQNPVLRVNPNTVVKAEINVSN